MMIISKSLAAKFTTVPIIIQHTTYTLSKIQSTFELVGRERNCLKDGMIHIIIINYNSDICETVNCYDHRHTDIPRQIPVAFFQGS